MNSHKVSAMPRLLYLGNSIVTDCTGEGVGSQIWSGQIGKRENPLTPPGFELRTVLPADSRFTDYASPAP